MMKKKIPLESEICFLESISMINIEDGFLNRPLVGKGKTAYKEQFWFILNTPWIYIL